MVATFSLEEIYQQVGQYDLFSIFEFHPTSNAAIKYGSQVYGIILYTPRERKVLEEAILLANSTMPRSNGQIFLDGALRDTKVNHLLLKEGFANTDVIRISYMNHLNDISTYKDESEKMIPNTIAINVEASETIKDHMLFVWSTLEMLIKDDHPLTEDEYRQYYTLTYILFPNTLPEGLTDIILKDPVTKEFYLDVEIELLRYKYNSSIETGVVSITVDEVAKYKNLLRLLRSQRFKFIEDHLGISKRQLDEFKSSNTDAYYVMWELAIQFRTQTLTPFGSSTLIYWDFESYIHILLRHYRSFFISSSTKGQGTSFQYVLKDIGRLIRIVIKNNLAEIERSLGNGLPFRLYNEQSSYFNGNYYRIWINKDGRIKQFHPED